MTEAILNNTPPVTSKIGESVKWIQFNRPEVLNAINTESADIIRQELESAVDEKMRVVVLTGKDGSFCSGADLKGINLDDTDPEALTEVLEKHYHPLLLALHDSPIPVVAAVDGVAAGIGCDLALACDIRLASENAVFSEIFGQVGLLPDGGGTFNLPRIVGLGRAMEMALTCQKVRAAQALEWGMVNQVYPVESFKQHVQTYVERLAFKAPLAVARTRKAIREAVGNVSFSNAIKRESELQKDLFASRDFKEGVSAFLQKRSPNFRGA